MSPLEEKLNCRILMIGTPHKRIHMYNEVNSLLIKEHIKVRNIFTLGVLMEINVGDVVKVICNDRTVINDPKAKKVFKGKVKSIFNAFDKDGDNWFYELVGSGGKWFLYKPNIDGGTIEVITEVG